MACPYLYVRFMSNSMINYYNICSCLKIRILMKVSETKFLSQLTAIMENIHYEFSCL